jgi:hypothetical protein
MIDKFLAHIFHFCSHFCKILWISKALSERNCERIGWKKGADVNEGKFVLNIDFIMALKPDDLCVYDLYVYDSLVSIHIMSSIFTNLIPILINVHILLEPCFKWSYIRLVTAIYHMLGKSIHSLITLTKKEYLWQSPLVNLVCNLYGWLALVFLLLQCSK